MARRGEEPKPTWRRVPLGVRRRAEALLGAAVTRADRAYGGYGPSATFRLRLADGRRAFFKGVYPLPEGSPVRWSLDREQRVFEQLGDLISPWAPAYYGAVAERGWHALLLEDLGPATVPPWTEAKARAAMRAYAGFHAGTRGRPLPRWLPRRRGWLPFARTWSRLSANAVDLEQLAGLAGAGAGEAVSWLRHHLPALDAASSAFGRTGRPFALLHLDTRSDNVRVDAAAPTPLRIFDWPFAMVGPPELDVAAFAQSVASEGGPAPERLTDWYAEVQPLRPRVLAGAAAAIAGFFAERAWQPPVEALPRLRSVQRRQLRASLAWAARLNGLPAPGWLDEVPP
jgi:Ser/Thr protein kinase RdoA (MazF antagonist)